MMNEAQHLANSMNRARAEAINSGFRVNLCQTGGGRQCLPAGTWEGGWILFIDDNHNGEVDDDETVLWTEEPAAPGVTMSANGPLRHYVSYTSYGPRANAQRRAANGNIHRLPAGAEGRRCRAGAQRSRSNCPNGRDLPMIPCAATGGPLRGQWPGLMNCDALRAARNRPFPPVRH